MTSSWPCVLFTKKSPLLQLVGSKPVNVAAMHLFLQFDSFRPRVFGHGSFDARTQVMRKGHTLHKKTTVGNRLKTSGELHKFWQHLEDSAPLRYDVGI